MTDETIGPDEQADVVGDGDSEDDELESDVIGDGDDLEDELARESDVVSDADDDAAIDDDTRHFGGP